MAIYTKRTALPAVFLLAAALAIGIAGCNPPGFQSPPTEVSIQVQSLAPEVRQVTAAFTRSGSEIRQLHLNLTGRAAEGSAFLPEGPWALSLEAKGDQDRLLYGGQECLTVRRGKPVRLRTRITAFPRTRARIALSLPVSIVAIGSSSTFGVGATAPEKSYPSQLQAKLTAALPGIPVQVYNKGVSGETGQEMVQRFDRDVQALGPDLVIWQTGTNDALRDVDYGLFIRQLEDGVARLTAGGVDVALMDSQYLGDRESERYARFQAGMADVAERSGVELIPRHRLMKEWVASGRYTMAQLLAGDQFHPSDVTYDRIATYITDLIVHTPSGSLLCK